MKHGSKEAIIEIELCGPPKQSRNPIIQRTITKDKNKSSFLLNGQHASPKEVIEFAQSFAIQVDNLCQFLPQDKVAEFAALTPVQLLHSTQRAAAGPEMLLMQDRLVKIRGDQKKLELENSGDTDTLANLENRQELQRADVERMRERAEIERKINLLNKARPLVEYKEHREAVLALRAKKNQLKEEFERMKSDIQPVLEAVQAKENYIEELNGAKDDRKDAVDEASKITIDRGKLIEEFDGKIQEINDQIDVERKIGQAQKTDAAKAQQAMNRLQRQLEEEPVEFDPEYFNETLVENFCFFGSMIARRLIIPTERETTTLARAGDHSTRHERQTRPNA